MGWEMALHLRIWTIVFTLWSDVVIRLLVMAL